MEMTNNFFEIFGIPQSFSIDLVQLSESYRRLQKEFHPDRFAGKSAVERHLAVRWAATINQAYDTLKSPLKRAQYLLAEQGLDSSGESSISGDVAFLMQQMQLREGLSEVRQASDPFALLETLCEQAECEYIRLQQAFDLSCQAENFQEALDNVAKMQFVVKLLQEMEWLAEELDE